MKEKEYIKVALVTKVGDQICAVGYIKNFVNYFRFFKILIDKYIWFMIL